MKGICARSNHVIQALLATTQTRIPSLDVGRVLKDIEGMEFNAYLLPANKDPLLVFRYQKFLFWYGAHSRFILFQS